MKANVTHIAEVPNKKAYGKPALRKIGSVRKLTLKAGSASDTFSTFSQ